MKIFVDMFFVLLKLKFRDLLFFLLKKLLIINNFSGLLFFGGLKEIFGIFVKW